MAESNPPPPPPPAPSSPPLGLLPRPPHSFRPQHSSCRPAPTPISPTPGCFTYSSTAHLGAADVPGARPIMATHYLKRINPNGGQGSAKEGRVKGSLVDGAPILVGLEKMKDEYCHSALNYQRIFASRCVGALLPREFKHNCHMPQLWL